MSDKFNTKPSLLIMMLFLGGCYLKTTKNKAESPSQQPITEDSKTIESKTVVPESPSAKTETTTSESIEPITAPTEPVTAKNQPLVKPVVIATKPVESIDTSIESTESTAPTETSEKLVENEISYTLTGQITLDQSNLKEQNAELKNTIVYFEPTNSRGLKPPKTNATITTLNKQFKPNVLAITAGSTISFPNMDRILHNVFSVSPTSEFDLGLYSAGLSKDVVFEKPGVIYVHCNVHHFMQADILVLDTPYFTQVNEDGSFELNNIPELVGTFKTWHPRGNIKSMPLNENSARENIQQSVVITRPEVPKHSNKFGKAYRRTRY